MSPSGGSFRFSGLYLTFRVFAQIFRSLFNFRHFKHPNLGNMFNFGGFLCQILKCFFSQISPLISPLSLICGGTLYLTLGTVFLYISNIVNHL